MGKWLRIWKWTLRITAAFSLLCIMLITGMIAWSATDSGKHYMNNLINNELSAATGYQIQAADLHFQFPLTITTANLSLADSKGVWLKANDVRLSILPTLKMQRHIIIHSISAEAFTLLRNPETVSSSSHEGGVDISIPNIIIQQLTLSSAVTGLQTEMSVSLRGSLNIVSAKQDLLFNLQSQTTHGLPGIASAELSVAGEYSIQHNRITFSALEFSTAQGRIKGTGTIDMNSGGIDMSLQSTSMQLNQWAKEIEGNAVADATVHGTLNKPEIEAHIALRATSYKEIKLPDTTHTLIVQKQNDGWQGKLKTASEKDISAQTAFHWSDSLLKLNDIAVNYLGSRITGKLDVHSDTLLADGTMEAAFPALEKFNPWLPSPLNGSAHINARISSRGSVQAVTIKSDMRNIEFQTATIAAVHMEVNLPDVRELRPQSLQITMSDGNYADISINKAAFAAIMRSKAWQIHLDAKGMIDRPFTVQASGNTSLSAQNQWEVDLQKFFGVYGNVAFSNLKNILFSLQGNHMSLVAPDFKIGSGGFSLRATRKDNDINAKLTGHHIGLSSYGRPLPDAFRKAKAAFTLELGGSMQSPQAILEGTLTHIILHEEAPYSSAKLQATVKDQKAALHALIEDASLVKSSVDVQMPVDFNLEPFSLSIRQSSPLSGQADIALDITAWSNLLLPPIHNLKGKIMGRLKVSGSYAQPDMHGEIQFEKGSYRYLPLGTELHNIHMGIRAQTHTVMLTDFHAEDAKGNPLSAEGKASVALSSNFSYRLHLNAHNIALINHPNARALLSGDITAQGDNKAGSITGKLQSNSLDIYLPDRFAANVPELNVVSTIPKSFKARKAVDAYPLTLDIAWEADNKVFVRGRGVDAELKGKIAVTGKADRPQLEGELSTIRGRYEEFGKQFALKQALITFEGDIPPSPFLNIVASSTESGVEIRPTISGPLLKPELKIESTPAMPQEEALSILLFGKDSGKISLLQAAQLANSMAKLSGKGGGGFNPLGKIRKLIGVDDVRLNNNSDNAADTSVGIGKYIGNNIYLEVERGTATESGKARVEVDVTPSISVESSTGTTGNNNVGVNWKFDY